MIRARFVTRVPGFTVEASIEQDRGVVVLFGPSGGGKSLTLQSIGGMRRPESGRIEVGGQLWYDSAARVDVPVHRRGVGWVPQDHSLFPHLDVRANVAFGLPWRERRASVAVDALLDELGLTHLAHARPGRLSGGERQRVALARALAVSPRALLLDEPFASLDPAARASMGSVLRQLLVRRAIPAILVTHDAAEAAAIGDVVVRVDGGRTEPARPVDAVFGPAWLLDVTATPLGDDAGRDVLSVEGRLEVPRGAVAAGPIRARVRRLGDGDPGAGRDPT